MAFSGLLRRLGFRARHQIRRNSAASFSSNASSSPPPHSSRSSSSSSPSARRAKHTRTLPLALAVSTACIGSAPSAICRSEGALGVLFRPQSRAQRLCSTSVSARPKGGKGETDFRMQSASKQKRSVLQEYAMKHKLPPPQYEVSQQGVSHAPSFQSKCLFMNREVIGTIEPTKALASESAAVIFHNRYIAGGGGGASELENGEIPQAAAAPVPSADNSYKHSLKESVVELKPTGVLILIDLDNLPRAVRTLDDYMAENEDHPVCEVIAYASMGFNPGEELPEYVQLRRASSLDRDAADILMVFETAMKMNDLVMHHLYKGVLIVSKDHFATRLKEILISYKINAHHEAAYDSIVRALEDKFPQR